MPAPGISKSVTRIAELNGSFLRGLFFGVLFSLPLIAALIALAMAFL